MIKMKSEVYYSLRIFLNLKTNICFLLHKQPVNKHIIVQKMDSIKLKSIMGKDRKYKGNSLKVSENI